ncbi:hypothetical protein [Aquabacterium humicola]|uniref:hypothetical protein n=1 Tax=Aquabacterium humicola TaxID=3237377 RepID=UPI002543BB39|nr:hypothetical protein [Rubrivivax pictus]
MSTSLIRRGVAALATLLACHAGATVVTFDERSHDADFATFNPVTSAGFSFSNDCDSSTDCLAAWGRDHEYQGDPGQAALFTNYWGTTTTMSRVGGGAFDLVSIDFGDVLNAGASVQLSLGFLFVDGHSQVLQTWLDFEPGLQTLVFDLRGLQSVSWSTVDGANGYNQFDNIVASAVLPEPSAPLLVLTALAAAGGLSRRRHGSPRQGAGRRGSACGRG